MDYAQSQSNRYFYGGFGNTVKVSLAPRATGDLYFLSTKNRNGETTRVIPVTPRNTELIAEMRAELLALGYGERLDETTQVTTFWLFDEC